MDRIYHLITEHWHLTSMQYWHLHLLSSLLLGPLLGVLFLVLVDRRRKRTRLPAAG